MEPYYPPMPFCCTTPSICTIMRATPFLAAALLITWAGCDAFLEPDPASFSSTNKYYQTPAHFERAINGAYDMLQAVFDATYIHMTELRADNMTAQFDVNLPSVNEGTVDQFIMFADNANAQNMWNDAYTTIAQTNVILGRIETVEFPDQALKDRIIGEAKFIRALTYWLLNQFYGDNPATGYKGGVPLILTEVGSPSDAYPDGRAPADQIWQQVISDLTDAQAKLPLSYTGAHVGRVTRGAATFLLGRTYLLTGDYEQALAELTKLETMGYELLPDYRSVFDPANKNNKESIFEIQYSASVEGEYQNIVPEFAPHNSGRDIVIYNVEPAGDWMPTADLIAAYEPGSEREKASIAWWSNPENVEYPEVAFGDSIPYMIKWYWPEHMPQAGRDNNNRIVFRYADALLSIAEAHWWLNNNAQAVAYVNMVRDRANEDPIPASLSGDALRDAILHERSVELAFEGHRWLDLRRFGVAIEVMTAHGERQKARDPKLTADMYIITPDKLLYPIPPTDVLLGSLEQNPGW